MIPGIPFTSRRWPIGLDLGADSIKMLQMQRSSGQIRVSACGRWQVPASIDANPAQYREAAASAIGNMLREGKFRGRRAVSALSSDQLTIKNVRLPIMPPGELPDAVLWEAKERFDFEISHDRLAYFNAGEVRQGTETGQEIIMMAVPSEVLDDHMALLSDSGLSPEHIDAQPVALFRSFERFLRRRADDDTVSVLVDIGLNTTRVVVARGRQIVFIKSVDIAGRKLNEAVAKQLNLGYAEASELRSRIMREFESGDFADKDSNAAMGPESVSWTVYDALRAEAEALAREVSLCLQYCLVTFRGLRPRNITITGGQAYDPALIELLSKNLNLECVIGRPMRNIDVSGADVGADRRGMMCEWAVCSGLAIRDMDTRCSARRSEDAERRLSA